MNFFKTLQVVVEENIHRRIMFPSKGVSQYPCLINYQGSVLHKQHRPFLKVFLFYCRNNPFADTINSATPMRRCTHFIITSGLGLHSLTTGSIPLVASKQYDGWGCRQFTMESSPRRTRMIFVVWRSQMKKDPSSEPATMYWPWLKETSIVIIDALSIRQCFINCTYYGMLNGRMTVNDGIKKDVTGRDHDLRRQRGTRNHCQDTLYSNQNSNLKTKYY
jgi:hypothetical protein